METILNVKNLSVNFKTNLGKVHAIRDVSFDLGKGETLAIVGETGSGKSVTTRAIMGLLPRNSKIEAGTIEMLNQDLINISDKKRSKINGHLISTVMQDPSTALDPTMKIGKQIMESSVLQGLNKKDDIKSNAIKMLKFVGIKNAEKRFNEYPHQFSGGQRQKIAIAIALINNPDILIADEPTTALDVTVQTQIIKLLKDLQLKNKMSMIFISHDLGVVAGIADRVAVMYAGKIVEIGTAKEIFYNPQHPYTWALLSAVPKLGNRNKRLYSLPGHPPVLLEEPRGDAFAPRNYYALKIDEIEQPPFFTVSSTHQAATWLLDDRAPKIVPPAEISDRWKVFKSFSKEGVV